MGRPELALGTHGHIDAWRENGRWKARTRFRDYDGVSRQVLRTGPTRQAAEQSLQRALQTRGLPAGAGLITPETKIEALAKLWYEQLDDLSPSTMEAYKTRLRRNVLPAFGNVRIREVSVGLVDRHLMAVRRNHGPSAARQTRNVLSGMFRLAARHDAMRSNPCRDVARIPSRPLHQPRSLEADEIRSLLAGLRQSEWANAYDLPDLVSFLAATGARIGEACAIAWEDVDFEAATVHLHGTVLRLPGEGLIISRPKSPSSNRIIEIPSWCVRMLRERRKRALGDLRELQSSIHAVFPAPRGKDLRDPSNTRMAMRTAFRQLGVLEVTSHTFRKSVATLMDQAGKSARDAADQLGHAHPSLTLDVYMGRKKRSTGAAAVLEQLDSGSA